MADDEDFDCILIGASTRAAAFSAIRADLKPWCLDLFADADLAAAACVRRIPFDCYPQAIPDLLRDAPPVPLIYTGGLENYPRLIDNVAQSRPLWGNTGDALRRSRDPFFLAELLREQGLNFPAVSAEAPSGKRTLRKPFKGAGGMHITFAEPGGSACDGYYFQEFISGPSFAAVFCAEDSRSELLGITRQLTGESWLHSKPFQYCGSIGPVHLPAAAEAMLLQIGDVLRTDCGLRGLFGVDFILKDDEPWVIEVNPRYTASIEVLEYATGIHSLEWHRAAFDKIAVTDRPARSRIVGKAILFAQTRFAFPEGIVDLPSDVSRRPDIADIPNSGEVVEAGWPILTLLAEADTLEGCKEQLQLYLARRVMRLFRETQP